MLFFLENSIYKLNNILLIFLIRLAFNDEKENFIDFRANNDQYKFPFKIKIYH